MKLLMSISALVVVTFSVVAGQRPSFAGSRPIGFPETPNRTTTTVDPLSDRFGEGTTERLPIEANGDRDLIDRLSKLPIDKQPFWFINWQALEAHRKNPQTYPQRPSSFVDPVPLNSNRFPAPSSQSLTTQITPINRFGPTTASNQFSAQSSSQFNFNSQSNNINPNGQIRPESQNNPNVVPPPQIPSIYQYNPYSQNPNVPAQSLPNASVPVNQKNQFIPISQVNPNVQINPVGQNSQFNFTSSSNTAVSNKNGVVETTQNYKWNYFTSHNTHTSHFYKYPDYYVQTDNPKRTGSDSY
ncbi:unnamed protein product [Spodoptera exigua]|uniref:Uncharacterized protein n=1 Tax=Spodoptera exigua TaxID=7107 RepID=A0A922M127_SPOEX|nr:hypothetical protein HF086_011150 [Spodoptera exigua]CAH0694538.1 unnamed protein product [Spodoptera exigua]